MSPAADSFIKDPVSFCRSLGWLKAEETSSVTAHKKAKKRNKKPQDNICCIWMKATAHNLSSRAGSIEKYEPLI